MDDKTLYSAHSRWTMTVVEGPGMGLRHDLPDPCALVVGRAAECDIPVDPRDPKASRRHARLSVAGGTVRIEDLHSTNGLFVDEARVLEGVLSHGARIRVGTTVFVLEQSGPGPAGPGPGEAPGSGTAPYQVPGRGPGQAPAPPGGPGPTSFLKRLTVRHWLYLCAGASLVLLLAAVFLGSGPDPAPPAAPPAPPAASPAPPPEAQPAARPAGPAPEPPPDAQAPPAPADSPASGAKAQAEQSRELFRQAMFQYNAGNLGKALQALNRARVLDPANEQAARWAVRTGTELDQLVDQHYRQGLMALKYMRRDEAAAEFRFVVESAPDPRDERVQDARNKLAELEGKKP